MEELTGLLINNKHTLKGWFNAKMQSHLPKINRTGREK